MINFTHRKRSLASFFFLLSTLIAPPSPAQTSRADSLITVDQAYADVWRQVLQRLDGFPIAERNEVDGVIRSERVTFPLEGILGLTCSQETQEFCIRLTSPKPETTSLTVTVWITRTQKTGVGEALANTDDYKTALLDCLTGRQRLAPLPFK